MRGAIGAPGGTAVAPSPQRLGKFTLLEQIGEGGMARIYLARSRGIGGFEKLVVVKQILPRLAEDAEFIARFFQEARLAATLDHPNIAAVYDVDSDRDTYFYSMEYVRGRDLQKVLRRAKQCQRVLSLGEILAIVTGLCAGLHHAHTRPGPDGRALGIVHRDVSPSNVLLSFEGAVKLADFGVAKARTGMVSTVAGTLRGKIAYMSPEQCRGEALDRRSDVYSVGVLLWEMLAGQRLHQGESEIGLLRQIAERTSPSPRGHRPDTPPALERIVARALALEPSTRYASAHALQTDLEEHARSHGLAVSASTIAALMRELFGEASNHDPPAARIAPTMPIRIDDPPDDSPDEDRRTPPTATVAPVIVASPRIEPAEIERTPAVPSSRSWSGVVVGLAVGIGLGGGGLWLALGRGDARTPATTPAADPPKHAPSRPPSGDSATGDSAAGDSAAGEPASSAAASVPAPPPAATPEPELDTAPVEAPAANETPAVAPAPAPRRKQKRRRPPRTKSINLDSPLPPGFDAK